MQTQKLSIGFAALLAIFAVTMLTTATPAAAQSERVLYSFNPDSQTGLIPLAALILDAAGNLYGTTGIGPGNGHRGGTVFELTEIGGSWTLKTLHTFGIGTDGVRPQSSLIFDAEGNLYGTTSAGGANNGGIVFELSPKAGGGWTEKILHNFGSSGDGASPLAGLILDASGNLYGTTYSGGSGTSESCQYSGGTTGDCGTVFELTPTAGGEWTEKILHNFGIGTDGVNPQAGLIFDAAGNLFGTTFGGGSGLFCTIIGGPGAGCGTAFELTPAAAGEWTEKILYNFGMTNYSAFSPSGGLIFGAAGNLFGTTYFGGDCGASIDRALGCGTVFELTPTAGGEWTESILYNFGFPPDPSGPQGGVIFDAAGNLYGASYGGGATPICSNDTLRCGTVYKLKPAAGGVWDETLLHSFGAGDDGDQLFAGLVLDAAGTLYGTTAGGGAYNAGTVFEILNIPRPRIFSFSPTSGPVGTTVVITGKNFTGATEVTFHDQKMATFTLDSDTQITATVPADAITGVICVWTGAGNADLSTLFTVTP